jgi:hypothetical protein
MPTTYTAHYCTDAEHAFHDIKADSPEQALRLARELWERDPDALDFEPYDSMMPLTDITIDGPAGGGLAVWQSDDLRLHLAATDLREALAMLLEGLDDAFPHACRTDAEHAILDAVITRARDALAKAAPNAQAG